MRAWDFPKSLLAGQGGPAEVPLRANSTGSSSFLLVIHDDAPTGAGCLHSVFLRVMVSIKQWSRGKCRRVGMFSVTRPAHVNL